jgi:hypothetical protein
MRVGTAQPQYPGNFTPAPAPAFAKLGAVAAVEGRRR